MAVVSRAIQIGAAFSTWFAVGRLRRGGDPAALAVNTQRQAERLKDILTQLGPAFVKIGQVNREDWKGMHMMGCWHRDRGCQNAALNDCNRDIQGYHCSGLNINKAKFPSDDVHAPLQA